MEEGRESLLSPEPLVPFFGVGDLVHVFEGTGVGREGLRNVGWFGKVVGREGGSYLVRNRLLAAKGRPNLVEGQFMKLQVDYGLECGSGERVHFRNLPKRTRERILNSADERNGWSVKESQKELTKVKKQKTQEKDVYLMRRQQILEQGTSAMQNTKSVYEEQVQYWQSKNAILQQKLITNSETFKRTSTTKEVFILFTPYLSYFICLVLFSPLFANMLPDIVLFVLGTNAFHA